MKKQPVKKQLYNKQVKTLSGKVALILSASLLGLSMSACNNAVLNPKNTEDMKSAGEETPTEISASFADGEEDGKRATSQNTATADSAAHKDEYKLLKYHTFTAFAPKEGASDNSKQQLRVGAGMMLALPESVNDAVSVHERKYYIPEADGKYVPFMDIVAGTMLPNTAEATLEELGMESHAPLLLARLFKLADNIGDAELARYLWKEPENYVYNFLQHGEHNYLLILADDKYYQSLYDSKQLPSELPRLTARDIADGLLSVCNDYKYEKALYLLEPLEQTLSLQAYRDAKLPLDKLLNAEKSSNGAKADDTKDNTEKVTEQTSTAAAAAAVGAKREADKEFSLNLPYVPEVLAPLQLEKDSLELALPLTENFHKTYKQAQALLAESATLHAAYLKGETLSGILHLPIDLIWEQGDVLLARLHYNGKSPVIKGKAAGLLYAYYQGGKKDARERVYGVPAQACDDLRKVLSALLAGKKLQAQPQIALYVDENTKQQVDFLDFTPAESYTYRPRTGADTSTAGVDKRNSYYYGYIK